MKTTITIEKEVDIKLLRVRAGVRYWEDATVDGVEDEQGKLIPCRTGSLWCPDIDVETGRIINWEKGRAASIHYKVCDCCGWQLVDTNGDVVVDVKDEYIPDSLCPGGRGYGDYIIMEVDANGQISDWRFDASDFTRN